MGHGILLFAAVRAFKKVLLGKKRPGLGILRDEGKAAREGQCPAWSSSASEEVKLEVLRCHAEQMRVTGLCHSEVGLVRIGGGRAAGAGDLAQASRMVLVGQGGSLQMHRVPEDPCIWAETFSGGAWP